MKQSLTAAIVAGLAEFSATNPSFTAAQVAEHFNVKEITVKKLLKNLASVVPSKGDDGVVTFAYVTGKRNIKRSDAERIEKISKYLRAACYNAAKTGHNRKSIKQTLDAWMDEYEVITA
jgi:hypothetical protein